MLPPSSQLVFIIVIKNNSQECFHRAEEAERGTKRNTPPPPPPPPSIQTRRTSPRLKHDGGGGRRRGALWFSKLSQWLRWCIWERCFKARIWLFTLFFGGGDVLCKPTPSAGCELRTQQEWMWSTSSAENLAGGFPAQNELHRVLHLSCLSPRLLFQKQLAIGVKCPM